MKNTVSLRDKFFGCLCGVHIGSALAAPVEGWNYQKIEETYGTLDRFVEYEHYNNGWVREPGTTEDGSERQKLMITAIIEKKDRVCAEDIKKIWIRDIKVGAAGMVSEPFEGMLLAMAKSGIPGKDLGRYRDKRALNGFARSCHPIALINAGNIEDTLEDIREVGQLYHPYGSISSIWAEVTGVAIARATMPGAEVDDVIEAIFKYCEPSVTEEIQRGLELTKDCTGFREMREAFDSIYGGINMHYAFSHANEIITKAISILKKVNGNMYEAMIFATNFGRDTDCLAAVSSGISGALYGPLDLPEEFIKQVDYATSINLYTNSQRTLTQQADMMYEAYKARVWAMREYVSVMSVC